MAEGLILTYLFLHAVSAVPRNNLYWTSPEQLTSDDATRHVGRYLQRRSVYVPGTVAARKCKEYAKYVFGEPVLLIPGAPKVDYCVRSTTPLVTGGEDALLSEFPHMARIGYGRKTKRNVVPQWACSGSLISERYILSAAHCVHPPGVLSDAKWANLGDLDWTSNSDNADNEIFEIVDKKVHPEYSSSNKYNDIVLFKLERDVELRSSVRPLCLQTKATLPEKAIATGWGRTGNSPSQKGSSVLQKVELNVVSADVCNKTYSNFTSILPHGVDSNTIVCAGGTVGKDTCKGDSGGPLQFRLEEPYCMFSVIGITSFGISDCGTKYPSGYTNVVSYIPWIEEIVWSEEFKAIKHQ